METLDLIAHGVSLLFGALILGGIVMESFMIVPLFRSSSPADVVRMHTALNKVGQWQHVSFGAIFAASSILAFILDLSVEPEAAWLTLAGTVVAFIGVGILVRRYLPLGRILMGSNGAVPPNFDAVFRAWTRALYARMALYVGSMMLFIAAALVV